MTKLLRWLGVFSLIFRAALAEAPQWPDAPAAVLREELFGIRFRLILRDKGEAKAAAFLKDELRKRPTAPEVQAYAAWVSLFPKSWGMGELIAADAREPMLRTAARAGSLVAKDVLGYALVNGGLGIAGDPEEGIKLLGEAAAAGHARSIGRLARMQIEGWHVPQDVAQGERGLLRALALGSMVDLSDLAEACEKGQARGIPPAEQPAKALEYYYLLALENDGDAWKKLRARAEQNEPQAALLLSLAYVRFANEGGVIAPSVVKRHIAVLEASGLIDPRVCVELGVAKLFGNWGRRDWRAAQDYLVRAAFAKDQEAELFLAYLTLRGFDGEEQMKQGLAAITALADAGHPRACAWLGYFYYWGTTEAGKLPKDPAKAFHYTRKGAELGSRWAALNLAHLYKHGVGTKENPVLAAKLYWMAWNYGVPSAKENLQMQLPFAKIP